MREIGGIPIVRKIRSVRDLSPSERSRLKRLKEIFRKEGRIPPGTSLQEMRYFYRIQAGRRRYQWRKGPSILERKEWEEARKRTDPYSNLSIEEILAQLAGKKDEQSGESGK